MTRHEFETRLLPLLERLAALEERLSHAEETIRALQAEHQPLFEPGRSVTAPTNVSATFHGITICPVCNIGYLIGTQHFCTPLTSTGPFLIQ